MTKITSLSTLYRKVVFIIFIGSLATTLNAQFSIGVRTGITKSWRANIASFDDDIYVHKNGFQISLISAFKISKTLSLGLEPGYVPRISAANFSFEFPEDDDRILLKYIEMPLVLSGRYPLWNEHMKFNVKAGYGIAWLSGAIREIQTFAPGGQPFREELIIKNSGWLNKMDHGFYSGIGVEYNIRRHRFILESAFYLGVKDVMTFALSKNRSLHLGITYIRDFVNDEL